MRDPGSPDLPHIIQNPSIRVLLVACALCLCSCGLFSRSKHEDPQLKAREEQLIRLQFDVMRLADQAILDLSGSARQFSRAIGTPDAHRQALSWTVSHTNRVLSIASNPRPLAALVDLLLFASVQRIFHEEYWLPKVHGEADRPVLEAFVRLEASCWEVVKTALDPKQQDALRGVLTVWREDNPDLGSAVAVEAPSFVNVAVPILKGDKVPLVSTLIDLVSLDPLAGLEPAVREVAATRQMGERMFFFTQHMPRLLAQQAELYTLKTLGLPEVQSSVAGGERFSKAAEQLAATAALLPEALRKEREGLVATLEQSSAPLQALLEQSRETLDAGTRTAQSITLGVGALQALVSHSDEKGTASPSGSAAARPFDVREYGDAAAHIGAAANELNLAIAAADERLPGVQAALDAAATRVERSVDHAYALALRLVFWIVGLVSAAVLGLRLLGSILPRRTVHGARARALPVSTR
jgi:hypothetical protein